MIKIIFLIVYLFSASIFLGGCDSSILQQREYSPEINSVLIKAGGQEGVKKRTRKHWEDIQQYDFSHKLDSIQTLKELENYKMRLAIAISG